METDSERTWTKEEYYRLGELGFFHGQRVELIGGRLMVMSPQGAPHYSACLRVWRLLDRLFPPGFAARIQGPIDLGATSEPEPDVAVVIGSDDQFEIVHPTQAVLVVEISDTTLATDRGRKASLYASVGILDYWIVNLVTPQVEVYRDPIRDTTTHFGYRYNVRIDRLRGQDLAALALPGVSIAVDDLIP